MCTDNSERGLPFNYFTQGVAATEVEIDCLTGDCSVLRVDIVMDVGKSINPALDIGQIEGAFVQGMGWSTTEELVWGDDQHPWARPGQLFTRGPGTYKIPSFNDVPRDFRVHLSDTDNRYARIRVWVKGWGWGWPVGKGTWTGTGKIRPTANICRSAYLLHNLLRGFLFSISIVKIFACFFGGKFYFALSNAHWVYLFADFASTLRRRLENHPCFSAAPHISPFR